MRQQKETQEIQQLAAFFGGRVLPDRKRKLSVKVWPGRILCQDYNAAEFSLFSYFHKVFSSVYDYGLCDQLLTVVAEPLAEMVTIFPFTARQIVLFIVCYGRWGFNIEKNWENLPVSSDWLATMKADCDALQKAGLFEQEGTCYTCTKRVEEVLDILDTVLYLRIGNPQPIRREECQALFTGLMEGKIHYDRRYHFYPRGTQAK